MSGDGEMSTAAPAGRVSGGDPVEASRPPEEQLPEGWRTYRDARYHFELPYPAGHEVLVNAGPEDGPPPRPLARIVFRDPGLGPSGVPELAVGVFDSAGESLGDWLEERLASAPDAESTQVRLAGQTGVRRCRTTYLAPGCSIWVAHGPWIYSFTPHGGEGDRMLAGLGFSPLSGS